MEANRDGAMDCLMKAKALLRQGHVDEARRLANKSKKMFSTTDCDGERCREYFNGREMCTCVWTLRYGRIVS